MYIYTNEYCLYRAAGDLTYSLYITGMSAVAMCDKTVICHYNLHSLVYERSQKLKKKKSLILFSWMQKTSAFNSVGICVQLQVHVGPLLGLIRTRNILLSALVTGNVLLFLRANNIVNGLHGWF